MRKVLLFGILVGVITDASGQTVRAPYPYEIVSAVPGDIASADDRSAIQAFLDEKDSIWSEFFAITTAACPDLESAAISVFDFAALLDTEDARAEQRISGAYTHLVESLSAVGSSELAAEVTRYRGRTLKVKMVDVASAQPEETLKRFRVSCKHLSEDSGGSDLPGRFVGIGDASITPGFSAKHPENLQKEGE